MSFCASRWIDGKNRFCAGWEFREAERSIDGRRSSESDVRCERSDGSWGK